MNTEPLHAFIEQRLEAVRRQDVDALTGPLAAELTTFDVVDPLRRVGSDASVKRAREWFGMFESAIGVETSELKVFAGDAAAFAHYLVRYHGVQHTGKINMWVRVTLGFAQQGGTWKLVHEHSSVPFDPKTGKASLTAQP